MNNKKPTSKAVYPTIIAIFVVAIVIVFNLVMAQLPTSATEFDLTGGGIYTVSEGARDILNAKVDDEIEITMLAQEDSVDIRVLKYIENFAAVSGKIKFQQVDPVLHPSALDKYGAPDNSVVVTNTVTGKSTTIPLYGFSGQDSAMLLYDSQSYYYYQQKIAISIDCEGQLVSAVAYVEGDTASAVYTLSGHGEETFPSNIAAMLEKSNVEIRPLDLLKDGAIPENCGSIICYNPATDLADDEYSTLSGYIKNGGSVILAIDNYELKNFAALLNDNGLEMLEGYVGDSTTFYQNYASYYGYYCFNPVIGASSPITADFVGTNAMVLYSRGMVKTDSTPKDVVITNLLTTTNSGVHYVDENNNDSGMYIIGADCANANGGHLIAFSSFIMFGDDITGSFSSLCNSNIMLNAATSTIDGVEKINIPATTLSVSYNTVKNPMPWIVLFMIAVPAAFIITGFVTWNHRRKR